MGDAGIVVRFVTKSGDYRLVRDHADSGEASLALQQAGASPRTPRLALGGSRKIIRDAKDASETRAYDIRFTRKQ